MSKTIVITGATGFLGREIVAALLRDDPKVRLTLLVRGKDDGDARRRGDRLLADVLEGSAFEDGKKRCDVVRADLEKEDLGLDRAAYEALVARTGAVIHGAASVSFSLPLDEARRINVEGTRRILDLARAAQARVDYIGTAYVAGDRQGLAREDELDVGQPFRNSYEQSKMEAEKLAQERSKTQPIAIFRPSIIVGDSVTGRTSSFKVLYWPLKIYGRGLWRVVPGRPETPVDVVPSDYVVNAILHIRKDPKSAGQVYHLAAGPERSATLGALSMLAAKFFGVRPAVFVQPGLFIKYARPIVDRFTWGNVKRILTNGRVYTPYLSLRLSFDTTNARRALEGSGIEVPRVEGYFSTLFRYCIDTEWGKKPASAVPSSPSSARGRGRAVADARADA
jgi:thioester reductase-like protein